MGQTSRRGNGEGTIYKRADGRWEGRLDLGWQDGRRRRKCVYGNTRSEVVEKLRKVQREVASGLPVTDERETVTDYLAWWSTTILPGKVKDSTADGYRWIISRYILPNVGRTRLARLSPADVQTM